MALYDAEAVFPDADPRFLELIDIINVDRPYSRAGITEAAEQTEIEHEHEHEVEEERHHERESYLEFHRVVGWTGRGILTEEAYKFLMTFDKGAAIRQRQRETEWASGKLAIKDREELAKTLKEARRRCWRARERLLHLAKKLIRREMEAKVQRFDRWQKSRRKVQIYHDRFDSRIAGYTLDQRQRLERYRDSLDKQSRFAFKTEKQQEAAEKVAELSRFQVANTSEQTSVRRQTLT